MNRRTPLFVAALALALAGCSDDTPEKGATGSPTRAPPDPVLAAPQVRAPLSTEDIEGAQLAGELACAFTERGAANPLLVTSDTPTAGGESPPLPARLEIASPAGPQQIEGEWTCGP